MSDWLDGNGNGARIDVPKLLDSTAGSGLAELVAAGALVSMGLTSDGGALGVTVTVDGRWRRDYFRDEDELGLWLAEAIPAVRAAKGLDSAPSVPRPRSRTRSKTL